MTTKNLKIKPVSELLLALDVLEKKYNPAPSNLAKPVAPKNN